MPRLVSDSFQARRANASTWQQACDAALLEVDRVAETQFLLRGQLLAALDAMQLTPTARHHLGGDFPTYGHYLRATRGTEYFDMATLLRLGSVLESGLRALHRSRSAPDQSRANVSPRVFQQLVDPTRLIQVFHRDCGISLDTTPAWSTMQELMVHRHLYAHRSGAIDDRYIEQLRTVTGRDITKRVAPLGYPDTEVLWFEPLHRLGEFIENTRTFFGSLRADPER